MVAKPLDEEAIFKIAVGISSEATRNDYLQQACQDDPALLDRVLTLLRAHDHSPSFLESPAAEFDATVASVTHDPGTYIGPYKLRERIGEGGMGEVFVAEQSEPVQRKVALKIIKPGTATKRVVARFEAERQALAIMDHPHIASVLDGGATNAGQPYFVMELVRGEPLTEYCDHKRLSTTERLRLFLKVCRAVQHAHQKGIIHRDIKPSNVLVSEIDGEAVPKVIDFGVAKAVSQRLTEDTVYTGFGQMVGTPLYMSPEQAGTGVIDIDTRSDVYSLGVLLYELLTGSTPFDRETLKQSGFDEFRRLLREEEPPRPSDFLSTLNAASSSTISERRDTDPRKLQYAIRGELDWIVMKALEKDRSRRYETANGLARDIERYLNGDPVEACPPSTVYRFTKFARRHRTALIVAATLLVSTFLVLGATTVAAISRSEAAERQRELADQRAEVQRAINEALNEVARLRGGTEAAASGSLVSAAKAREQAERALALAETGPVDPRLLAQVQNLVDKLDQEQRERRLAELLDQAWLAQANMEGTAFNTSASMPLVKEALATYGIKVGKIPPDACATVIHDSSPTIRKALLATINECFSHANLAGSIIMQRAPEAYVVHAVSSYGALNQFDGLQAGDRIIGVEPQPGAPIADAAAMTAPELWALLTSLTGKPVRLKIVRRGETEPRILELPSDPLADWLSAVLRAADSDPWRRRFRSTCQLADVAQRRVELATLADEVDLDEQPRQLLVRLGRELSFAGDSEQAVTFLQEVWQRHPSDVGVNLSLALILQNDFRPPRREEAVRYYTAAIALRPDSYGLHINLGNSLSDLGELDEAIASFRTALAVQPDLAIAHDGLGGAFLKLNRLDDAASEFRKAIHLEPNKPLSHSNLSVVLRRLGRIDEAMNAYRAAIQIAPDYADAHNSLGVCLKEQGRLEEAIAELREAINIAPGFANAHSNLGNALRSQNKVEEAIDHYREAIRINPNHAAAHNNLGTAFACMKQLDKAITSFRTAIGIAPALIEAHHNLGNALVLQQKFEEAAEAYRNALCGAPDSVSLHYKLGNVLGKQGKTEEAIEEYREVIRIEPNSAAAHNDLGYMLERLGRLDEAIAQYRAAVEAKPDFTLAHQNIGMALAAQERFEEAIAEFQKVIRIEPNGAGGHYMLGRALFRLGRSGEAVAAFRQAVAIDPRNANTRNDLGLALEDQQQYEAAIVEYREALMINPTMPQAHNNLALVLANAPDQSLRRPEVALEHAQKVVELVPTKPLVWGTLGIALYRNGQWTEAVSALEKRNELGAGDAYNWWFLAMAHWQLGNRPEARHWYQLAAQWMEQNCPPADTNSATQRVTLDEADCSVPLSDLLNAQAEATSLIEDGTVLSSEESTPAGKGN